MIVNQQQAELKSPIIHKEKALPAETEKPSNRFERLKKGSRDSIINLIKKFRAIKREHEDINLEEEETELIIQAQSYDNITSETEQELKDTGIEIEANEQSSSQDFQDEETQDKEDSPSQPIALETEQVITKQNISKEEKEKLERKFWCKSNRLTEDEEANLLNELKAKIQNADIPIDKKEAYEELHDFIERNGYIFPEFSHGTCSVSFISILRNGILPLDKLSENIEARGERDKINPKRKKGSKSVSAGMGRYGLGLAVGYARREEDPLWKMDEFTKNYILPKYVAKPNEEIEKKYKDDPTYWKSDEFKDYRKARYQAYKDAYKKLQEYDTYHKTVYETEYPMVVGFSRTTHVTDILEKYPRFESSAMMADLMHGEVMFYGEDIVPPETIEVVAVPKRKIEKIQAVISKTGKKDIKLISLEAIDALQDFGIPEIKEGEKDALNIMSFPQREAERLDKELIQTEKLQSQRQENLAV